MLPFHPYADLFPLLEGEQFAELVADVKANDLRERIVVWDGAILDGRNRYRAALAAGLLEDDDEPDRVKYFVRFVPAVDGNPLAYVISKNLKRRHLNESQRAYVAAKLANLSGGRPSETAQICAVSQDDAAVKLNVSRRSVQHAVTVREQGVEELQSAVEQGKMSVSAAALAARLDPIKQRLLARDAHAGRDNLVRNALKQESRATREINLAEKQAALPSQKFGVIYADPEWRFEPYSRDSGMDRAADNHYPTTVTDEICARQVADIAADDCVLFLWATVPMLPDALRVMATWGFKYKSHCIWTKDKIGTGYWFRNAHELLLVGTKGNIPAPAMGTQLPSTIEGRVGKHSAKPECFAELIEQYFPSLPKIELNRRGAPREGWSAWGNESIAAQSTNGTMAAQAQAEQQDTHEPDSSLPPSLPPSPQS